MRRRGTNFLNLHPVRLIALSAARECIAGRVSIAIPSGDGYAYPGQTRGSLHHPAHRPMLPVLHLIQCVRYFQDRTFVNARGKSESGHFRTHAWQQFAVYSNERRWLHGLTTSVIRPRSSLFSKPHDLDPCDSILHGFTEGARRQRPA
jgi:hypothetical protein